MPPRSLFLHALLSGALVALGAVCAPAALPLQSFEALSAGQSPGTPWQASGAVLAVTDLDAASGEHSLRLPPPTGTTATEARIPAIVLGDNPGFVDLWLKPVARTLDVLPPGHSAAGQPTASTGVLYLDGAQFLFQRNANRYSVLAVTRSADGAPWWVLLGGFAGAPVDFEIEDTGGVAKDWLRLTVRRDLAAGTYDVWINQRMVGVDLGLHRTLGHPEFRLLHQPSANPADGALAAMLLDDIQATAHHPLYPDTDRDAMPDVWEAAYEVHIGPDHSASLDVITPDRGADLDFDSVPKISEYFFGSRPTHADTDGDGIPDGVEIAHGLNPVSSLDAAQDKDGDGFSNLAESQGQGNGNISVPPAGALTNVVYVKADHEGVQNGHYSTPYRTLAAALASPYLTAGGRIVLRGDGGPLYYYDADWSSGLGNGGLTIARPVTLVGVNLAQIHLQESSAFATINIPTPSTGPVFVCENIAFDSCWGDDGGVFRIIGTPGEVVIRNCRFSSCHASDDGGALYAHAAKLTIEDCWFENCWSLGEGGAMLLEGNSQASIRRTEFRSTSSDTDGGAVSLRGATTTPIRMENCVLQGNYARRGAALAAVDGADATLIQCTVASNAGSLAGSGASLFGASSASVISVSGCIFWNNAAATAAHAHLSGGAWSVTYSTLSGWTSTVGPIGTGNNGSDPGFRAGTLVPSASAMLDSSNPAHNTTTDFLNNSRWDAPGGTAGTLADRGAFERQPDSDADGLSDDWEIRYALNPKDPADADTDADQDGYSNYEEFIDKTDPRNGSSVKAPVVFVNPATGKDWHPGPHPPAGTVSVSLQGTRAYPFQSIRRAILACPSNRRIVLADGSYSGPRNTNIKLNENWAWVPHLSTATLTSSLFLNTKTIRGLNGASRVVLDGGGATRLFDLTLATSSSTSIVTLQNLSLRRGAADLGGAIHAVGSPGRGQLLLHGCILSANSATNAGGAIHVTGASLSLTKCALHGNDAPRGGAVALVDLTPMAATTVSTASFSNCRFAYNLAHAVSGSLGQGGALCAHATSFTTYQTRFDFNHAERHGGAMAILSFSGYFPPSFGTGTHFEANTAIHRGGGLYTENATFLTTGGTFVANRAGTTAGAGEGGAIFFAHPATITNTNLGYSSRSAQLTGTRFLHNLAGQRGGAVAIADSSPLFTNCAFVENHADHQAGHGGAAAVIWQVATSSGSPVHPSAPLFVHATFARNQAALAANVHSQSLTAPWLINTLCSDGFTPPSNPSLLGPRHLHGCQLASPDSLLSSAEASPSRRNIFAAPTLAFDWIHLATPVRLPGDSSSTTGGIEPSTTVTFTRPTTDIDNEARPPAASGKFTLIRGCDEPRDADNDSLPDWFESLAIQFSTLDAITTTAHTHPLTPNSPTLPSANPTNNADADAYTLTQELLHGGRPDAPESDQLGRDSDGDGLSDIFERLSSVLHWQNPDINGDGVLDGWAYRHFGTVTFNPNADDDGDGLSNGLEAQLNLNPRSIDSDGDGVPDAWEVATNTDPNSTDSDGNGQPDHWGLLPTDAHGHTPPGIHQPTTAEPWYVEHSWTYFHYNPGNYFYPAHVDFLYWGIDTMNDQSDFLMEPIRPIPPLPTDPIRNFCVYLPNLLGPHLLYRDANTFNHSLWDVTSTHREHSVRSFFPLTQPFEELSAELTSLIGQERTPEWAAAWYSHAVDTHRDGYSDWTVGRARQRWLPHNYHHHIQHIVTRIVPTYRLRCTLPDGAPDDVSLTFIRVRGRAAQRLAYSSSYGEAVTSHPLEENNVSVQPVVLTLARGQHLSTPITLDPFQSTPLSNDKPKHPVAYPATEYFDLLQFDALLPYDIVGHKRGSLNEPGQRVPLGFGAYGQETTILENADFENADPDVEPDSNQDGNLDATRRSNDDDLAKILIRWPRGINTNIFNLSLTATGMQFDPSILDGRTPIIGGPSRLRFYTSEGIRVNAAELPAVNLLIAFPGLLQRMTESGAGQIFFDGGAQFGSVNPVLGALDGEHPRVEIRLARAACTRTGGALLRLELTQNETQLVHNVQIHRGGFLRFVVPEVETPIRTSGVIGQLEFRDGKGRMINGTVDLGERLATYSAKSGIRGGQAYDLPMEGGHIPPGWYFSYRRTDFNGNQEDVRRESTGKVTIRQGSYVRWLQDDEADMTNRYTTNFRYDSSISNDSRIGEPTSIQFKWQLEPIIVADAAGRTQLQIHPDGLKNGTMGCIGIQSYNGCISIDEILSTYHQLKLLVTIQNPE